MSTVSTSTVSTSTDNAQNLAQNDAQYDLVVMGATGFVGRILCRTLLNCAETDSGLKWAIAGRSRAKQDQLIAELGPRAAQLPCLYADVTDEATLRDLCNQTRVVISTVGPYALYGEPLVKVCAETGTDYCDLTGEVQWIRRMVQTYGTLAEQSGSRIVPCCGFDSIPSDLGVYYLQQQSLQQFEQPCGRVKMRVKDARGGVSGGTIASVMTLVQEAVVNPELRREMMDPYSLCPDGQKSIGSSTQIPVQYDADFQAWISPFIMAEVNTRIVLRSNALLNQAYGSTFDYDEAILTGQGLPGWAAAHCLKLGLDGFALASAFTPTAWLLTHTILPQPGEGPSEQVQDDGSYDLRFWGQTATGATIRVKVTGDQDPGYGSTAKILAQAGLCLAQDIPKVHKTGGFWTPATLFGDRLIERLVNWAGMSFDVI